MGANRWQPAQLESGPAPLAARCAAQAGEPHATILFRGSGYNTAENNTIISWADARHAPSRTRRALTRGASPARSVRSGGPVQEETAGRRSGAQERERARLRGACRTLAAPAAPQAPGPDHWHSVPVALGRRVRVRVTGRTGRSGVSGRLHLRFRLRVG